MSEHILMRGNDGKLYKVPQDVAKKHVVNKEDAAKLFATREAFHAALRQHQVVTQFDSGQLPDFNVLLQTEYTG